jgi:sigma-B regulation protein RsbU (phosphoserine phosphatase)
MRPRVPPSIYGLLLAYILISLGYQLAGAGSLIIGFFDLRHQVDEAGLTVDLYKPQVTKVSDLAGKTGIAAGDTVESLDGVPYTGHASMQSERWYAHVNDSLRVVVRKPDGRHLTANIPLHGFKDRPSIAESIFVMLLHIVIPLLCLFVGYSVVFARPIDLSAWLILILLSYPGVYVSVSTSNFWPPLLALRLYWHLSIEIVAPAALLWFGLLFPERSKIDIYAPWLKWLMLAITAVGLAFGLLGDYASWFNMGFLPAGRRLDEIVTPAVNWVTVICIALYWVAIFAKLRTASTADIRRRLRVLCVGSVAGLGSALIIWGILPHFGLDPVTHEWLGYASAVLILIFPFSLAYVVVVQRAMDLGVLLRMGSRYVIARTTLFLLNFAIILLVLFQIAIPLIRKHDDEVLAVIVPIIVLVVLLRFQFIKRGPAEMLREWVDRRFFREAYNTERVLADLAIQARSMADPAKLIETISSRISEVLHVNQMAVMLRTGDVFQLQTAGAFGEPIALPVASLPVQHLVRTSAPAVLYRDQPEEWFEEAASHERRTLDQLNAEVLLPLVGRDKLMGVMVLGPKKSEEPYSPSDLELLASIGVQAGLGLEVNDLAQSLAREAGRLERVRREVEIAREVQERLFPEIPAVAGIDIAGHCRPALGVGGDYYDVVPLEDGRLAIAIGDISGKGIAAALLMASLRASLRGIVDVESHDLARIVSKLNRLLHESSTSNRYATFFFGVFNPATMKLHYVNAGHNPPIVLQAQGATKLEASGPVVGLLRNAGYEEAFIQLISGDIFIGYTDGISEAMTLQDEEWGEDRMQCEVEAKRAQSAKEILESVFQAADNFTAGAPQHDDMTLMVLRFTKD